MVNTDSLLSLVNLRFIRELRLAKEWLGLRRVIAKQGAKVMVNGNLGDHESVRLANTRGQRGTTTRRHCH